MTWGFSPAMSRPRNWIEPDVGRYKPAMMLKNVVLPAPFGPMMAPIVRSSIAKSIPWSAISPPNRLVTPTATNKGLGVGGLGLGARPGSVDCNWPDLGHLDGLAFPDPRPLTPDPLAELRQPLPAREQPRRPQHHHQDEREPVNHELRALQIGVLEERQAQAV